jgi:hypothetical protein
MTKSGLRPSEPHVLHPPVSPLATSLPPLRRSPPPRPQLRVVPPPLPLPPVPTARARVIRDRPLPPAPVISPPPPAVEDRPLPPIADPPTSALLADPALANAFEGILTRPTTMHRLFAKAGEAGGQARAKVARLVEHLRLLYQLKLMVQIEHLKQRRTLDQAQLNKWIVSTYKAIGFTVLTLIVLALVSYMGANVFYWFSSSWIEPTVISSTDERVLQLSTQLAEQASTRDRLAADLADSDRVIAMHEEFLDNARKALTEELADRKAELARLTALDRSLVSTRSQVRSNSRAYSGFSRRRIAAEYTAHLIDREEAVTGALQLSQIAQGNLGLAEKEVELDKRLSTLSRETESLASVLSQQPNSRQSYEVLRILQDLKRSQVELAKARDSKKVLEKSLARYEQIVRTISESPWLRAVERKDTIAFVPYDNLDKAKPGAPLYACSVGLFFCHQVGKVVAVLAGEMTLKHPLHNTMLRGQSVQVELKNPKDAESKVLFAGGRPILF